MPGDAKAEGAGAGAGLGRCMKTLIAPWNRFFRLSFSLGSSAIGVGSDAEDYTSESAGGKENGPTASCSEVLDKS